MQRIMLLNPKGGSGKTTIATGLASYFAGRGHRVVIFDHDAQGSSTRWLELRPSACKPLQGVAAFRNPTGVTRSWHMRVPPETDHVVIDTPAGVRSQDVAGMVQRADHVIVPVLPSHIDIDAVCHFVEGLNALPSVRSGGTRVAVVANRVRANTVICQELEHFLAGLDFPFVARFRDSQNYVRACRGGVGIHDLPVRQSRVDRRQWAPLLAWIDERPVAEMMPREGCIATPLPASYPLPL
jgi:chromosome partitioning protein